MSRTPNFPELQEGHYAVVCAERDTGIVLSLDGSWAIGDALRYRVFASLDAARSCAAELVAANPCWEATVYDSKGAVVSRYVGDMSGQHLKGKRPSTSWWFRWFGRGK